MIVFQEHLDYIARVTRVLNNLGEAPEGFYLEVVLRDSDDSSKVGYWCDEIASDNWWFDTDPQRESK